MFSQQRKYLPNYAKGALRCVRLVVFLVLIGDGGMVMAQDIPPQQLTLPPGMLDHGVAVPISRARGVAATVDGNGKPVILVWLSDQGGCRKLLMLDADTGQGETYDLAVPYRDSPFAILLSKKNRFYSLFADHFVEFDPVQRAVTFFGKGVGGVAMAMTEDSQGVIWAANYPDSHLTSFNPATRTMINYGPVNKENWPQYSSSLAVDKTGWIYVPVGNVLSHLIAFNPKTREIRPLAKNEERKQGTASVFLGADGVVYGQPYSAGPWYIFSEGKATPTPKPAIDRAPIKTGSQETVLASFPDGRKIKEINVPEKWVDIFERDGAVRRLMYDYRSEGSDITSILLGPDKKIYGCTGHPLRVFAYDPTLNCFTHHGWRNENGHWNALALQHGRLFGAMYGGGYLFDYNVAKPWNDSAQGETNPRILANGGIDIGRPHALLAHPDGRHLVMTGTPGYGYTGGGMMLYDLDTGTSEILGHHALLSNLSTVALDALNGGNTLVGGTSIAPGTGGETLAKEGELYLMDFATRKITFHAPIIPGASEICDLKVGANGLVYGLATGRSTSFFVFDPIRQKVIHQESMNQYGATTGGQAPRVMLLGPDQQLYVYFRRTIVKIEPGTFKNTRLLESPVNIDVGIVLSDGRLYFTSGSRLFSWAIPKLSPKP